MNDVTSLIRRITADLHALQSAMEWASNKELPYGAHDSLLDEIISTALVAEFKGAIDNMRHFLWFYIEAFAAKYQAGHHHTRGESHRLQLVAEMLRTLSQRAAPTSPALPETMSFFERIESVVSSRMLTEEQAGKSLTDAA